MPRLKISYKFLHVCLLILTVGSSPQFCEANAVKEAAREISTSLMEFLETSQMADYSKPNIAVINYDIQNAKGQKNLPDSFANSISIMLSETEAVDVVERIDLESLLDEQSFSEAGFVSRDTARKIGEMLGARYILSGQLVVSNEKLIAISFLTDIEKAFIIWAHFTKLPYRPSVEYSPYELHQFLWIDTSIEAVRSLCDEILSEKGSYEDLIFVIPSYKNLSSRKYFGIDDFVTNYTIYEFVSNGLHVVERGRIEKVFEEINAQKTGVVNPDELKDTGFLEPDTMVIGEIQIEQDKDLYNDLNKRNRVIVKINIGLKFIERASGKVVNGATKTHEKKF